MAFKIKRFDEAIAIIRRLPENTYFSLDLCGTAIGFQADTQKEVRALMACFPGVFWAKDYNKGCNWWQYFGKYDGFDLEIYACYEGPATCKAIEEEYETTEQVPVRFEERTVTKKRIRWECPETEAV